VSDNSDRPPEDLRVGATIKALREAHGLSTDQLARAIGKSGQLVRAVEVGRRHATPQVCRKIADTFGVPLAAITVEGYERIAESA